MRVGSELEFVFHLASLGRMVIYSIWRRFGCPHVAEVHLVSPHVYKLGNLKWENRLLFESDPFKSEKVTLAIIAATKEI